MEDKDILSRCVDGNHEVFEVLVNKYQADVLTFICVILGSIEEAKDITQETFIQALLNIKLFDQNKSFKNWLYAIAYRKCMDTKRREKLFFKYLRSSAKLDYRQNKNNQQSGRLEESALLGPVLQKLSRRERIAVLLQMNEGYSTQEIAEILKCSEGTARVTLHNAKRKIKKCLRGDKNV